MAPASHRRAAGNDLTVSPQRELSYLLSRLDHLLDSPDVTSSRSIFSTKELQLDLEASALVSRLEPSAGESTEGLQKLANKANALLTRREGRAAASLLAKPSAVAAGLILAISISRHSAFDAEYGVSRNAVSWTNAALAVLTAVAAETPSSVAHALATEPDLIHAALALLSGELLTRHALEGNRPDYMRTVVAPTVPKLVLAATACLEKLDAVEAQYGQCLEIEAAKVSILSSLEAQVKLHPTTFRTHSAKLHSISTTLLRQPAASSAHTQTKNVRNGAAEAALSLLCALHVTGSVSGPGAQATTDHRGKATQGSLWTASIRGPLNEAWALWSVVSSSFGSKSDFDEAVQTLELPDDELQALPIALDRLEVVLGLAPGSDGRLSSVLAQPSTVHVGVPLAEILQLATSMLEVTHESRARAHPPVDAKTQAAQAAALYRIHIGALGLLLASCTAVASASPESLACIGPEIVSTLLDVAEASSTPIASAHPTSNAAVGAAALQVLSALLTKDVAAVLLDPASPIVLRLANLAHARVARLVRLPGSAQTNSFSTSEGSGRKAKKPRLFESDGMTNSAGPENSDIAPLSDDGLASALTGIRLCTATFPLLSTALTPAHGEAARSSVALVMAVTELALGSVSLSSSKAATISSVGLSSLSIMLPQSHPAMLPLLISRCSSLANLALEGHRSSSEVQKAGRLLRDATAGALVRSLPVSRSSDLEDLQDARSVQQPRSDAHVTLSFTSHIAQLQGMAQGTEGLQEGDEEEEGVMQDEARRKSVEAATVATPAVASQTVAPVAPPALVTFGGPPASATPLAGAARGTAQQGDASSTSAFPSSTSIMPQAQPLAPAASAHTHTAPPAQGDEEDDDDEDVDMPEIDLGDSEDESEASQEA